MKSYLKFFAILLITVFLFSVISAEPCAAVTDDFRIDNVAYDKFPVWGLSAALEFKSGDYGGQTTTRTVYMPFKLSRYLSNGMFSLTIPYIEQEGEEQVTIIGGKPFRSKADRQTQTETKTTESGLGDIVIKGEYDLSADQSDLFFISALGKVKFPTADENKGLGTGEYDFGFGIKNKTRLNKEWKMYAGIYYTFIGEPPNEDLDNELAFDLGLSYRVSRDVKTQFFYEQSTAIVPGDDDPKAVIIGVSCDLEENTNIFGDLSLGLSDGSADTSILFGINIGF